MGRTTESGCRCGLVWDEAAHCPCWPGPHGACDVMATDEKAALQGAHEKRSLRAENNRFRFEQYLDLGSTDL